MRDAARLSVAIAFLLFSACGGDDDGPADTDGGMRVDSGGGGDAAMADGGGVDAPVGDAGPMECGNFELEGTELCDDGNTEGGDGCSPDCTSDEVCGNGITDDHLGELCDDGNTLNGDGCNADCTSDETCGNGTVDASEVCDDGNTMDDDGCSADCSMGPVCGDGEANGGEACDDGNTTGGDGCSADCTSDESCGNAIVDAAAGEMCDDGNTAGGDGCSPTCNVEVCGNGILDAGEDCDDDNDVSGDGCEADCTFSCAMDADCDDGALCNGSETCNTTTHVCAAGTNAADATDCGGGMVCRSGMCVPPVCGNGIVEGTEVCDDGDSTEGDGCDNDCTPSCTMDSECADAEVCNGTETCNTTTNVCTNPPNLADGTSCGSGLVCRSGVCTTIVCGNGAVEMGEDCDDGNSTNGDGCDNDCTFSCTTNADCTDGLVCNGSETCNTTTNVCSAGTPPAAGTACDRDMNPGTRDICRMGTCVASRCGDGFTDMGGGEQCDDANTTEGDGCDNDCTFSCAMSADCDDGRICNGAETCNTTTHVCAAGTNAPNGTLCDRDMNAMTRDICRMGTCSASTCGDGFVDMGAGEACDDGNATPGDGCEPDCTVTGAAMPTAYRIDQLDIREPHLYDSFPIFGCYDITDSGPLGADGVNDSLNASVDDFSLNYITVHRPLDRSMMTNAVDFVDGTCMAGTTRPTCSVGTMGTVYPLTATNMSSGTCFTAHAGTTRPYTPAVPTIGPPCFVTGVMDLTVNIAGIAIPLKQAQISATYGSGTTPATLGPGVIAGFLETADAMMIRFPDDTPAVGGDTLYQHLAAGRATGSSCSSRDDRDDHPVTGATDAGFWFYIQFASIRADWTGP